MTDVRITCDRFRCVITPLTPHGKTQLRHLTGNKVHEIGLEYKSDFIEDLKKRDVTYEEH